MTEIRVTKQQAEVITSELLVSGSVKAYQVAFEFSPEWDTLSPTAVFRAGDTEISVILLGSTCTIPWEVLVRENVGQPLYVGVYGVGGETLVLPTVWGRVGVIREGAELGDNAEEPTPTVYEQYVTAIAEDARVAESAAESTADDAATAVQAATRATTAAGVSEDAATAAQAAQRSVESAVGIATNASRNAELSSDQAIAAKNAAESAAQSAETAAGDAATSATLANTDATLAESAAESADRSSDMAIQSERNAKASENVAKQAAQDAVGAWNNIKNKTVTVAERTYPTAPQIEIVVEEAVQAIAITEIGGVPIQQFEFAEMRFYCENAVQSAADASELRVALNRSSTGMYTAATDFLVNTRALFTSGGVSLKDGVAWTAGAQTNRTWRGPVVTQIYPNLEYGRVVRSVNFWSNSSLIPVGTKIQVWLR